MFIIHLSMLFGFFLLILLHSSGSLWHFYFSNNPHPLSSFIHKTSTTSPFVLYTFFLLPIKRGLLKLCADKSFNKKNHEIRMLFYVFFLLYEWNKVILEIRKLENITKTFFRPPTMFYIKIKCGMKVAD